MAIITIIAMLMTLDSIRLTVKNNKLIKRNELLEGQQSQYRRVLYENNLIPKEFLKGGD